MPPENVRKYFVSWPFQGIQKWNIVLKWDNVLIVVLICTQTPRDHPLSTYAKYSKKLTFLTPWYAHVRVCIRRLEMLVFRKILRTDLMNDPQWICIEVIPIQYLLVKLQEWKHESNVWNLFYVNNKENRITPMKTHLSNCSGVKAISMRGVCYEQLLNVPKCLTPDSFKLINICWEFGRQIAPWCPCKLWSLPSLLTDVR